MKEPIDLKDVTYCDRVEIKLIYELGYRLINEVVLLYHMLSFLNKYNDFSKEAKPKLKWIDYYHQCGNVSKIC